MPKLATIATAGIATLVTGWALQQAYKATGYYPPQPVFWFATGATASIALAVIGQRKALATRA